jgi:hypothetical protein
MVSWWPGDGNANDIRGGNNGTLQNGVPFVSGEVGQAFSLNGNNQSVLIGDPANLHLQDFTLDAWIQRTSSGSISLNESPGPGGNIFGYGNGGYEFGLFDDGTLFLSKTDISDTESTGAKVTDTNFHHVAVTKSGSIVTFFVDGVAAAASSSYDPGFTFGTNAYIGQGDSANNFYGNLDEIEIFNRSLSQSEIQAIFNAGAAGKCKACAPPPNNLVSWWRAEGNALDMRGGNNGTLQNGLPFVSGEVGQSFSINGTNQGVLIGNPANLQLQDFTIDAWIQRTSTSVISLNQGGPGGLIFSYGNGGYGFGLQDNGTIFVSHIGVDGVITTGLAVTDTNFHHVAVTKSGSTVIFFLDGVAETAPVYNTSFTFSTNASIGQTGTSNNFYGNLDEIEIFNRALTASEIQTIYNAGSNGKCVTCTLAPRSLVSWWPADGNAFDVRSSNNGTLLGHATFASGEVGQAFSFDGTSGTTVNVPKAANLDVGNQVTVDFWMKGDPSNNLQNCCQGLVATDFYVVEVGPGGIGFSVGNGTGFPEAGPVVVSTNIWHHIAGTYDGSNIKFYVDGVLQATAPQSGSISPMQANSFLSIGSEEGRSVCPSCVSSRYFNGLIDEVEIFNRALSQPEIQAIYDAGSAGKCKPTCLVAPPNLVGWWGGDGDARDISGSGNNGTLQGGAGFAIGKVGQAFTFNGVDGYVSVPGTFGGGPEVTIDAWVETNAVSSDLQAIVSPTAQEFVHFQLSDQPGNSIGVYTDQGLVLLPIPPESPTGVWRHIAITVKSGDISIYVNGVQTASSGATFNTITSTSNLRIGSGYQGARFFHGQIDEVEIFSRALSATEVQQIYNAGLAGKCKSATSLSPVQVGDATITFTGATGYDATEIPIDPSWAGTLPVGDVNTGLAYDIQTDTYSSSYDICFNLQAITDLTVSRQLRVLHGESGILLDRTTSYNPSTHMLCSHVTSLSPFAIAQNTNVPTAAGASISGLVTTGDGQSLAGVVIRLSGMVNETTVTDSDGHYEFDDVGANQFYAVTPQLANFTFSPSNRSFSLLGNRADAIFTAIPNPIVTANPLDTSEYFVRQQYLDFLGREPDAAGLAYWTDQLNQCGSDASCISQRRIDISAAYFMSDEFQQSASFVYRIYEGALGRRITYAEFAADRQQLIAANSSAAPTPDQLRAIFTEAFVQRPEFMQQYRAAITAETFVDTLLQTIQQSSGVDLAAQRGALLAKYGTGQNVTESRSLTIVAAIDDASFTTAEYNPAFVLTEYFAYLRRDPDQGGYDFWLSVLNNAPNNYRGMVCSFITSAEYQRRFAPVVTRTNQDCGA